MKKTLLFLVLLGICAITTTAQTGGSLGLSFGKEGTLIMPNDNIGHAQSVAVQTDGKIITAGQGFNCNNSECNQKFTITRHNTDGTLDPGFGDGGVVFVSPSENGMIDYSAYAANLVLAADGKILVTGEYSEYDYNLHDYSNYYTTAIRLNTDGSVDNSFGENGIVNIKLSAGHERAQGIAVQADSKVILVGLAFNKALNTSSMTVSRLNADGSLDNSFDGSGKILVNFPNYSEALSVKIQPDNKIVVCGIAYNENADAQFAVVRLNSDGSYDNGFDSDGKTLIDLGGDNCFASDLDLQADGKIVIGGYVEVRNGFDYGVARLNTNGSIDNSFNKNGKKLIDFNSSDDVCFSIAVDKDGKIFMGGYSNKFMQNSNYHFNVTKLNSDGSLDIKFEDNGTKLIDFGGQASSYDFALQDAGHIVTVGYASHGQEVQRALASFSTSSTGKSQATSPAPSIRLTGLQLKSLPNSATNGLAVLVTSDNVNEKISLRVIDPEGRLIERQNNVYSGQTYKVGSNIIPGIYYVEATQGRQRKVLKIIKFSE